MKRFIKKQKSKGFTMAEILVTLFTFCLFSTALMGMLVMGMRYLKRADKEISSQQLCTDAIDYMVCEIRQGVPNFAGGTYSYKSFSTSPSSVLVPQNINGKIDTRTSQSAYIRFTGYNYTNLHSALLDPSNFDKESSTLYQVIEFYITQIKQNDEYILYEKITPLNSSGYLNTSASTTQPVIQIKGGRIDMYAEKLYTTALKIGVIITKDVGKSSQKIYSAESVVSVIVHQE